MSYDEMMLASLIGASGPTYFINTGERKNRAVIDKKTPHEERGIIVGLVGPRLSRPGRMDSVHIYQDPPKYERLQHPALSNIFRRWLAPTASPLKDNNDAFDVDVYRGRIRISLETFLYEADDRAAQEGKTAYAQLTGLGLGVWKQHPEQPTWFMQEVLSVLKTIRLEHISTLEFSWIDDVPEKLKLRIEKAAATNRPSGRGMNALFNKRAPAAKLKNGELLVFMWAWDGNSFAGNEYWWGALASSADPAAACFSTVAELMNPFVNKAFPYRQKVLVRRDFEK
ncbi:hypothetical protein K402DRAFT_390322 [Aulographum hederae CBS 113979]|uniref:Uncharacterized protein n=1 Tax=Aulographum hederae CBS 113979 TaxID=1176131 RepID=A0A6G1HAM0_9PEZI|nr:hypothetical protein K402DRAFT_390322 [Aulographum hederae CBS 113979]